MMNMVSKKVSTNSSKVQASSLLRKGQQAKKTPRLKRDSEIFPIVDDCYPDPRMNQRLKGHRYPIPYASD